MDKEKKEAIKLIKESDSFMVFACKGNGGALSLPQDWEKQNLMFHALPGLLIRVPSLISLFEMTALMARDYLKQTGQPQPFSAEAVVKQCEDEQDGKGAEA
jgi:hypothetical protein